MAEEIKLWETGVISELGNVLQCAKIIKASVYENIMKNELAQGAKILYEGIYKKDDSYIFVVFEKKV